MATMRIDCISLIWFATTLLGPFQLFAQKEPEATQEVTPVVEVNQSVRLDLDSTESVETTKRLCRQYNNQYIGYYDQVFHVVACIRYPLDSEVIYQLQRSRKKIVEVGSEVIAYIPSVVEGWRSNPDVPRRGCRILEGKYISYSSGDVYFIESCKKRVFQDWASYESHRGSLSKQEAILSVTYDEYTALEDGEPMPSVLDQEMKDLLKMAESIDIIPADEACRGLNDRFVSYYSKVYKVERCRKRQLTEDAVGRIFLNSQQRVIEMSSQQWLSIPDGPVYR
jgi:hypothetical protein